MPTVRNFIVSKISIVDNEISMRGCKFSLIVSRILLIMIKIPLIAKILQIRIDLQELAAEF